MCFASERKCLQSLMMHWDPRHLQRLGFRALLPLVFAARISAAQDTTVTTVTADSAGGEAAHCDGRPVSTVHVDPDRPEVRGLWTRWQALARKMGFHHHTTSRGLIRRFVSLFEGRTCTEFRREESQRILRAQPYLADAVVSTRQRGDSIHVDVETTDEVPIVAGARLRGANIYALSLGTMNFLGAGMHVEGKWERDRGVRQGFGGRVEHPQLFGRPYSIRVDGMRRPIGEHMIFAVQHPLYTDLQRIAWNAGYYVSKDFAHLRRPDRSELLQPLDRAQINVGGVLRFGPPKHLGLIGGVVIRERFVPRHEFFHRDSITGGMVLAADTANIRAYETYDVTNVAAVLGVRALSYSRVTGLDAIGADQDIATGTQVGMLLGARPWSARTLSESFAAGDAFFGGRQGHHYAGVRIEAEARLDVEGRDWKHLIVGGRAAWYYQPNARWVSELALDGAGGWRTILPLQLELGDRRTGLRGYARSLQPGGQRLVGRAEERADLMRFRKTRAAIGAAAFTEAGRVWAGDVPFGVETPVQWSAGIAILAAVPAKSQRTIRAEVAVPFNRSAGARTELRFVIREPTRGFWREPDQLRWARLAAVPEGIFTWP